MSSVSDLSVRSTLHFLVNQLLRFDFLSHTDITSEENERQLYNLKIYLMCMIIYSIVYYSSYKDIMVFEYIYSTAV
jgi:hypothetical protein